MKKISFLTIALIVSLMAGTASAANGIGVLYADNMAETVGTVMIDNDGSNLSIIFNTFHGWKMTETNLHVATSFDDIPQNKNGNPKVGKFDHSTEHALPGVNQVTYTLPLPADNEYPVPPGQYGRVLYIVAHAVVVKVEDGVIREETSWAWCNRPGFGGMFPGNNWALYLIYFPDQEQGWVIP